MPLLVPLAEAAMASIMVSYAANETYQYFDDDEDKYFEQDKMRGSDAKKREKKQINDKYGKRSEREENSKELHRSKKGKRNDDNYSWKDLDQF